jgi:hypothetical protein
MRMLGLTKQQNLSSKTVQSKVLCTGQIYTERFEEARRYETQDLDVGVAERSTHRAHRIANSDVTRVRPLESHGIGKLGVRGSGVRKDSGSVDCVGAFSGIHVLP